MLGNWNADRKCYEWKPGARVEISPEHSARGLMEPGISPRLTDGRLLVVWRGSTHGWDGRRGQAARSKVLQHLHRRRANACAARRVEVLRRIELLIRPRRSIA